MGPPLPHELRTSRLWIRAPRADDGLALAAAVGDSLDSLQRWLGWAERVARLGVPDDLSVRAEDAARRFAEGKDPSYFLFLAERPEVLVGEFRLATEDWGLEALEASYWIRDGFRRQGLLTEAAEAIFDAAFDLAGAALIEARVGSRNVASRRALENLGFQRWGDLADHDRYILFPVAWQRRQRLATRGPVPDPNA